MVFSEDRSTCDGKPLCPYAKRAPIIKCRKSSSSAIDQGKLQRDALMLMVDKLVKYPQFILQAQSVIFSSDFKIPAEEGALSDESFTERYSTIDKIGKGWLGMWLLDRCKKMGVTQADLEKLDKLDSDAIVTMFCWETQLSPKCVFPKMLSSAMIAGNVFATRADDVSPRLDKLTKGVDFKHGKLNFGSGLGSYEMMFDTVRCTQVMHISGAKAVVPAHVVITRDFSLFDNWSDSEARVELLPSKYFLSTLFDAAQHGFMQFLPAINDKKGSKMLMDLATAQMEDFNVVKHREVAATHVDKSLMKENAKERRGLVTVKARAAIQAKLNQRGEKRKMSLKSVASVVAPSMPAAVVAKEGDAK